MDDITWKLGPYSFDRKDCSDDCERKKGNISPTIASEECRLAISCTLLH